jgi:excisionase family DNA binding protein
MPVLEPLAISPEEAAALLSVNKRTVYRLIARKKLIARKSGSRTIVDYAILKAYYSSLPQISGASIPNAPRRARKAVRRAGR